MNDWVASYLVKENYLLTALEFYQELKEAGKEQLVLSKLFKHREYNEESFAKKQKDTEIGLPPNLVASSENSKLLQNEIQKKDEKINVLQYEIRILKSDVDKLKQQLSEAFQKSQSQKAKNRREKSGGGSSSSNDSPVSSTSTPNADARGTMSLTDFLGNDHAKDFAHSQSLVNAHHYQSSDNLQQPQQPDTEDDDVLKPSNLQPINQQEKQVINYMIKHFLLENDYKISAISFSDEVNDTDMISMDDIWNNGANGEQDQDLNLLYLYRYYYKGNDQTKQRMKDTKALRDALSSIEQKNKMIKTYEQSLLSQEKNIDRLESENQELRRRIADLESGGSGKSEVATASIDKKPDYMPRLLPRDSPSKPKESSPTESIREISVLQAKLKEYEDKDTSLIHLIGQKLPILVRSVKANKREEFMPIITTALQMHPEYEVRNKLAGLLFNLIKVPDATQREMIMDGCVSLVRKISPDQFENELLPQCWEQVDHKYPERRILVADACGQLASYISPALRSSLLLSVMSQLITDRVEEVRLGVATNMARLVQSFEEVTDSSSKYSQVEEMMFQLLYDRSYNVAKVTRDSLAPVIVRWTNGFNAVFDKFMNALFKQMEGFASKQLDKSDRDTEKLLLLLETVKGLVPSLYNIALDTMPEELDVDVPGSQDSTKKEQFDYFWTNYNQAKHKPIIDKWNAIRWISENGLERLITIIVSTSVNLKPITDLCNSVIYELCLRFGRKFTGKVVQPQILFYLSQDPSSLNKRQLLLNKQQTVKDISYLVRERLLPAYIAGALGTCEPSVISDFIRELVVSVGLGERGWTNEHLPIIKNSLSLGCKMGGELMEQILSVLWNLCVHPAKTVRHVVVGLFYVLMDVLDSQTISTRLLKALVTMSTDPERSVRISAIHGLGYLATNISADSDFDKLGQQFDNFFNNPDPDIRYEALKTLSQIIPKVEPYFRDQYILKRLVKTGSENNLNSNQDDRRRVALLLFECYRALNGCILTRDAVQKYIINGMEMLERDCDLLSDSTRKIVGDMIRDLRRGLDPNYVPPDHKTATVDPNANKLKQLFTFGLGGK